MGASSISKIGKTNTILRGANINTPVKIRFHTTTKRNNLKSMIQEHHLENCQRTNRSPDGICLGYSFKKNDFVAFLQQYKSKHNEFIKDVTSLTLCGDEGKTYQEKVDNFPIVEGLNKNLIFNALLRKRKFQNCTCFQFQQKRSSSSGVNFGLLRLDF